MNANQLELNMLPDEARKELMNYYQYLVWKYVKPQPSENKKSVLPDVFYHPIVTDKYMKICRDEIYENE